MEPLSDRDAVLTAYARSLIQFKARQLCRKPGFSRSDHDDLAQELTLRLLEKAHHYDPARGATLDTFADRVINSAVKMILRDRRRLKRAAGFTAVSLESTTVIVDDRPVYLTEAVGDADLARVTLAKRHGPDPAADLAELLDGLPPELVDIAHRLQDGTVASVARDLGTSRRQVYAAMARSGEIRNPDTGRPSQTFEMAGKADGIVRLPDGLYLLEHKTASSLDGNYLDKLWTDTQIALYCHYLRQMGYPIVGVIYNVLLKARLQQRQGETEPEFDACRHRPDLAGVGFVFSADDPYCGIDLDDAIEPQTTQLKPWAREIVTLVASYTEISPSGGGVKIFLEGTKPGVRCRKRYHDGEVEIYDRDRFFTVTGAVLDSTPVALQARQGVLQNVYRRVFGEDVPAQPPGPDDEPDGAGGSVVLDDQRIIDLASRSRSSGAKFAALWDGRWNEYFNSWSEADSSVVFTLAFYTKDAGQIDRLFRTSGLMRDKWDQRHGQQTYGALTIANALATVTKQYEPRKRGTRKPKPPRPPPPPKRQGSGATCLNGEPAPGTIDAATGRLILSTERSLPTAEAFVREFHEHPGGEGRTIQHYAGMLMAWRGNRYVEVEDDAMRHRLLPWLHAAVRMNFDGDANRWVAEDFPANPHTVKAALDSVKAFTHLPASTPSPSWLRGQVDRPGAHEIVPCLSSLLHLPTMTHLVPTPAFFAIHALDYDPVPEARVPEAWLHFLDQILGEDLQARDLLQDWFGYCLTGDTSQHKMLLLVGPKRSGKGTKTLTDKLLAELPGILNWAIEGWRRLRERGHFVQPASVDDAIRDMEDLSSPVGAFVRERCVTGPGCRVWVDDLYSAWKSWCEQDGRSTTTTKQTFGRDLAAVVPGLSSRVGTGNFRFYQGIGLNDQAP